MRSALRTYVRKADIPCIAVTHSFRDAISLGDRMGVMERGRIVHDGTPEEMMGSGNEFLHHFFCGCRSEYICKISFIHLTPTLKLWQGL